MNETHRAIQQIESVQHISDCRRFSSGDIHGLVNGGKQLFRYTVERRHLEMAEKAIEQLLVYKHACDSMAKHLPEDDGAGVGAKTVDSQVRDLR